MRLITLSEFKSACSISDKALVWLLEQAKLNCTLSANGEILIDIEKVKKEDLLAAVRVKQEDFLSEHRDEIKEQISALICNNFESIIEEALSETNGGGPKDQ